MAILKWFGQSRKSPDFYEDFGFLGVDFHSHLLPRIDDGSNSYRESLEMIHRLEQMGFHKLITTPHIMAGHFDNTAEIIKRGLDNVREKLARSGSKMELEAAAEYYADDYFIKLVEREELMTFSGNFVLFEISMLAAPANLHELIFKIQAAGYRPILAHPERYPYFATDPALPARLKELGCRFQLNLMALSGLYGAGARTLALDLLDKGWYEFAATDLHRPFQLEELDKALKEVPEYDFKNRHQLA